jgi:LPS-assembly protein
LLVGLQYDTCCWAVRMVGVQAFTGLNPNNNKYEYNNLFFIQFALKGLGNIGNDPTSELNSITGYSTKFGQGF